VGVDALTHRVVLRPAFVWFYSSLLTMLHIYYVVTASLTCLDIHAQLLPWLKTSPGFFLWFHFFGLLVGKPSVDREEVWARGEVLGLRLAVDWI